MESMTSNPNRFATSFNVTHPDACRRITIEDVEELKLCELIHRYGFYSTSQDGKTIMNILRYEQLREKRLEQEFSEDQPDLPKCKICGQPLPIEPEGKGGRPKEYCSRCEPFRSKERQKSRRQRRKHYKART